MNWNLIARSWNPNVYGQLRDTSLPKLVRYVALTTVGALALFLLLLLPALLQGEEAFERLAHDTDITLSAEYEQRDAVYLFTNPDIIVTTGSEDGFITVTPEGFSIRYFLFFGERTYPWILFSDIDTVPFHRLTLSFALFAFPSAIVWGTLIIAANLALFGLLYTLIAYFVLKAREYHVLYVDLWKVTLLAGVPGMLVFAVSPILRLGLPVAVIIGLAFSVWLVFSLLGSTLVAHHGTRRSVPTRR